MCKKLFLLLILGSVLGLAVFCQNTEQTLPTFALENGFDFAYNINANTGGSSYRVTIQYGLTDKLEAEFSFLPGGTSFDAYTLFGLGYAILPRTGLTIIVGKDTSTAANVSGVGIWSNLFGRSVQGSLETGLKLRVEYLAPVTAFNTGILKIGMAAFLGM